MRWRNKFLLLFVIEIWGLFFIIDWMINVIDKLRCIYFKNGKLGFCVLGKREKKLTFIEYMF